MKKLLLSFVLATGLFATSFAQTTPVTAAKKEVKTTKPAATATPAAKTAAAPEKKDGTPDMRYKANKENAAPVTHTKKDGTADKRYKENKKN